MALPAAPRGGGVNRDVARQRHSQSEKPRRRKRATDKRTKAVRVRGRCCALLSSFRCATALTRSEVQTLQNAPHLLLNESVMGNRRRKDARPRSMKNGSKNQQHKKEKNRETSHYFFTTKLFAFCVPYLNLLAPSLACFFYFISYPSSGTRKENLQVQLFASLRRDIRLPPSIEETEKEKKRGKPNRNK